MAVFARSRELLPFLVRQVATNATAEGLEGVLGLRKVFHCLVARHDHGFHLVLLPGVLLHHLVPNAHLVVIGLRALQRVTADVDHMHVPLLDPQLQRPNVCTLQPLVLGGEVLHLLLRLLNLHRQTRRHLGEFRWQRFEGVVPVHVGAVRGALRRFAASLRRHRERRRGTTVGALLDEQLGAIGTHQILERLAVQNSDDFRVHPRPLDMMHARRRVRAVALAVTAEELRKLVRINEVQQSMCNGRLVGAVN
mmetsp:Transcript_2215/g.5482  ORF Transcript_2215/g.5482 Transcript_2215/m.5482 type:complete len:251 (+) Transcript_2215:553-1305(+)